MKFVAVFGPYLLAVFAFCLYLFTAAPFTLWLDAPRFVAAIYELGVANPAEPLFVLLAHPFIYIPFGTMVFRIQIFSALTAAITLVVLYKLANVVLAHVAKVDAKSKDSQRKIALSALFAAMTMAFSYQFWSQAQNVENFILVTLIAVTSLWLSVASTSPKRFFVNYSLIALLLGLATGTNPVIVSIVPAIIWMMWVRRKVMPILGFPVWGILGVAAIVAIHLYIPVRAAANPFLNYWRATSLENVWKLSTGAGLNVYVPDIGRINGFTGSPEIFFQSTIHYVLFWLIKFTPLLLPFMVAGTWYVWKKNRNYAIMLFSIIGANWLFSALYFSGNQESWFLMSDIAWVILGGLGYYWLTSGLGQTLLVKIKTPKKYARLSVYLILLTFVPLVGWFYFLDRRGWTITEDYIKNLYRPMGNDKSIIFGSSDLYDSISFYTHDIPGTSVYKPNVVPITDNLLYILKWYRDNIKSTTDLKIPDDSHLKYDLADEYSRYVNDFFDMNVDTHKIFITIPALRNNFLYAGSDLGPSLHVDEKRFKLIPQGMVSQVVRISDTTTQPNPEFFNYTFTNAGFPKKRPFFLEQTYKSEFTGVLNEYAYSYEGLGDMYLKQGDTKNSFTYYQHAYDFNPKNAEIVSRLGNYYGMTGDHTKAAQYFEQALKIEPRNIGLLFNAAIAYENTGRIDKAIANLNRVMQLSKPDSQIRQLAQTRLQALQSASGSAQVASGSAGLQNSLLPKVNPDQKEFKDEKMNLGFSYPKDFKIQTGNGVVTITNSLKDKDQLTLTFYSGALKSGESIDNFEKTVPFEPTGAVLITQLVGLPGFESGNGKTFGTGEHLTFMLYLKTKDMGYAVKIYPGDTTKTNDFNQIIQSIHTLK